MFGVVAVESFAAPVWGAAGLFVLGSAAFWVCSPLYEGHCADGTDDEEEMKKRRMRAW